MQFCPVWRHAHLLLLRIKRDESFESNISGVYPCGEGAGYAGGITSAAIDGIKVAEAIIKKYRPDFK